MAGRLVRWLVPALYSPTSASRPLLSLLGSFHSLRDFGPAYYSSEIEAEVEIETRSEELEDEPEGELRCEVWGDKSKEEPRTEFEEKSGEDSEDKLNLSDRPKIKRTVSYLTEEGKINKSRFRPFLSRKDVSRYVEGSFEDLFRNSSFARTRNPVDKDVEGIVIAVNNGKMYVDFGGKFHGVTNLPEDTFGCHVGARVVVTVKELEAVGHFIGDCKHHSLMEAAIQFKRLI